MQVNRLAWGRLEGWGRPWPHASRRNAAQERCVAPQHEGVEHDCARTARPPLAGIRLGRQADSELVELHLIDAVAGWIAGAGTTEGAALLRFRAEPDVATVERDLATRCALARLSEIDDIHLASMITPGAIVIPGALTLAAALPGITRDDFTGAVLAGYETMTRLGRAVDGPSILYRGIWPTYFAAPFGIAAVGRAAHAARPHPGRQCAGACAELRGAGRRPSQCRYQLALDRGGQCRAQRSRRSAGGETGIHLRSHAARRQLSRHHLRALRRISRR